jgi:preprotein translocase subunit SecE
VGKLLGRIVRFFREVRAELAKVIWPSRQQTLVYTGVVIVSVVVIAAIISVADAVLGEGMGLFLR